MRFLVFLFIFIFSFHAKAGTIDPGISDSKYIEYATKFECVYKICGSYNDGVNFCASAVVIDPHWILTAAHVVQNYKVCSIHKNDKTYQIKKIIINKDFEEKGFGVSDIALGYIEENIGLDFYPELYENHDEVGKVCSISGYGLTGTFLTGANKFDNKQRAGSNRIDTVYGDLLVCSPSSRASKRVTSLEFLIASGDSGGGLFIDGKLAGINSCVLALDKKTDSNYGDESGHTRISKFIDWIKIQKNEKKK